MATYRDAPLYFDDFRPGDEWASPARTVTEADVVNFAGISGDFNAIHVDHHAARAGAFGRPVAHGLLGLAMASGLSSHAPRVATLAFLAIERWSFTGPIAFGDTIHVLTRVESIHPQSERSPRRGRLDAPPRQPGRRHGPGGPDPDPRQGTGRRRRRRPGRTRRRRRLEPRLELKDGPSMQYRTEIHVADDRYVCLQLPDFIPAGRATVTVSVTPTDDAPGLIGKTKPTPATSSGGTSSTPPTTPGAADRAGPLTAARAASGR